MAESPADAAAVNADTLKVELKKTMTEILDDGGVCKDPGETDGCLGDLKRIDEAVSILNSLRDVETKKPESASSSSVPEVPKEFKCKLSYAIMSEPVVIATGQTYEKRYITEWLKSRQTCPNTKQVLSHRFFSPNHSIHDLITQWCLINTYDRPKLSDEVAIGLFPDDIDSLLHRISSPSSVEDQTEAAGELCSQTDKFTNVRAFFVAEIPDSITRLLSPLSALGSNLELQEKIVTTLVNISNVEENRTVMAQNPLVIPLLTKSLKQGTDETRRISALTLATLSIVDSNKIIIGNSSETLRALIDIIKEGDLSATKEATYALFNLFFLSETREKAVSEGAIPALTNMIKARRCVDMLLSTLTMLSLHKGALEEIDNIGFIDDLFSILRNPSCSVTCEVALAMVARVCCLRSTGDRIRESSRLKVVEEEENKYGTFTKLATQGSGGVVTGAEAILKWLNDSVLGEEPPRG